MKRYTRDTLHRVEIELNGVRRGAHCESRMLLSDFLRGPLGATGVHVGCEHGVCGACTVRIDGVAQRSCLALAVSVDGQRIDTVEGLTPAADATSSEAPQPGLSDLQAAFRRHHALQCGFCTPGILMSAAEFLERVPHPDETAVREMLSGHLCRCTGYSPIVGAILEVAAERARETRNA